MIITQEARRFWFRCYTRFSNNSYKFVEIIAVSIKFIITRNRPLTLVKKTHSHLTICENSGTNDIQEEWKQSQHTFAIDRIINYSDALQQHKCAFCICYRVVIPWLLLPTKEDPISYLKYQFVYFANLDKKNPAWCAIKYWLLLELVVPVVGTWIIFDFTSVRWKCDIMKLMKYYCRTTKPVVLEDHDLYFKNGIVTCDLFLNFSKMWFCSFHWF